MTYDVDIVLASRGCQYMLVQNFIKLSAAVHKLSCPQTFLPYLAMVENPKIRSCDLDL